MTTAEPKPEDDVLLRALRELPAHPAEEPGAARLGRAARTAFVEATTPRTLSERLGLRATRAVMPVVLASIVGVYMLWALQAASALLR